MFLSKCLRSLRSKLKEMAKSYSKLKKWQSRYLWWRFKTQSFARLQKLSLAFVLYSLLQLWLSSHQLLNSLYRCFLSRIAYLTSNGDNLHSNFISFIWSLKVGILVSTNFANSKKPKLRQRDPALHSFNFWWTSSDHF